MMKLYWKKAAALILALSMVAAMAACGSNDASSSSSSSQSSQSSSAVESTSESSTGESSSQESSSEGESAPAGETSELAQKYADAITAARDDEMNEVMPIQTTLDAEKDAYLIEMLGFGPDDVEAAAISVSMINVKAYGVAVVKPAEGHEDVVKAGLEGFVEYQKKSFEQYLADQYEVAKAARVETLEDGTMILVMCEDQDTVYDGIVSALNG